MDRFTKSTLLPIFVTTIAYVEIDPTINNSHIERFLNSHKCMQYPYACQAKMRFEKFKWEIHYIKKVSMLSIRILNSHRPYRIPSIPNT